MSAYRTAPATFHGGPWDGQTRCVELRDAIMAHWPVPLEPVSWPAESPASIPCPRVTIYRAQRWGNERGETEWRYYAEGE